MFAEFRSSVKAHRRIPRFNAIKESHPRGGQSIRPAIIHLLSFMGCLMLEFSANVCPKNPYCGFCSRQRMPRLHRICSNRAVSQSSNKRVRFSTSCPFITTKFGSCLHCYPQGHIVQLLVGGIHQVTK